MLRFLMKAYYLLSFPLSVLFILGSSRIHPAYRMGPLRKLSLGLRMLRNTLRIQTGSSYKSHLAMALKILETPPELSGVVVECGTWKGGCAANLSLVCRIAGRRLVVFDSFEGLPEGEEGDREAKHYRKGDYCGSEQEVRANVARFGAIECCEFVRGWFAETLPRFQEPVLLAFVDVDLEASLETCVLQLWPRLVERGYLFIDEYVILDYCALFWSERFWREHFDRTPPGLIGSGTGLALGDYYIGPWSEREDHPAQMPNAGAYTRKDLSGTWAYGAPPPPSDAG
jgi:O-methyltransferase